MKIAMVSPNYLPMNGGTQIAIHNIAKNIMPSGHDLLVVTRRWVTDDAVERYDDVPVRSFIERGGRFSFFYSNAALYPFLKHNISDVDVIHQFHLLRFGLPVTHFGKCHRKPVITTLMGTDTYDPEYPLTRLLAPYLGCIMNGSTEVTSPSRALAEFAYRQGYKREIQIIPHGIDPARFVCQDERLARLKETLPEEMRGKRIILSVGRLHSIKRPDVPIRAMAILRDTFKLKDAVLILVGDGPENGNLKRLVHDLGLQSTVEFRGHVAQDHIADYYHLCDVFTFHSTFETFGIVLAEAMACGKPVVSTMAGAIAEVVDHGETGLLVPPNDPVALAEALRSLVADEALARRMGREGRQKALARYDWRSISRRYLDLYARVVKESCAG